MVKKQKFQKPSTKLLDRTLGQPKARAPRSNRTQTDSSIKSYKKKSQITGRSKSIEQVLSNQQQKHNLLDSLQSFDWNFVKQGLLGVEEPLPLPLSKLEGSEWTQNCHAEQLQQIEKFVKVRSFFPYTRTDRLDTFTVFNRLFNLSTKSFLRTKSFKIDIYGPVGSGKTHLLKKVDSGVDKNMFWINGLSLLQNKMARLCRNVKNNILENIERIVSESFRLETPAENERFTLIIDEYDQIKTLQMENLIQYAYQEILEKRPQSNILVEFSQIILVSNEVTCSQGSKLNTLASVKTIFIPPLSDRDIQQITRSRLKAINEYFRMKLNTSEQEQTSNQSLESCLELFQTSKIREIVKRVNFPKENDIRSVQNFYESAFSFWKMKLKTPETQKKISTDHTQFLISSNWLLDFYRSANEMESNIVSYIRAMQPQGRVILQSLHNTVKNAFSSLSMGSNLSEKEKVKFLQCTIRDFYWKISHRLSLCKVYHWVVEWEQVGILTILHKQSFDSNDSEKQTMTPERLMNLGKIKLTDNWKIQIKAINEVRQGLGFDFG